jgi:hypothetical protein
MAALALYPGSTSPLDTYLSELGNADLSPNGWVYYDLAMILGGLLAVPFFMAVAKHYSAYGQKGLVRTGLAAGLVNGVSVVLAGAVAEHVHMGVHMGWSLLIFVSYLPLLVAYSMLLWSLPGFAKPVSLYGYAVCGIDVGLLVALLHGGTDPGAGSLMEWVAVFAFLLWVVLLTLSTWWTSRAFYDRRKEPEG